MTEQNENAAAQESVTDEAGEAEIEVATAADETTLQGETEGGLAEDVADTESAELDPSAVLAAERLADLQRLQADYVNYKRRVERDRGRERDAGASSVIEALLPVMDDIHSAREHGELADGPMAAIADKIETVMERVGARRLGVVGETFDPNHHEALMHVPDAELPQGATGTVVVQVFQPGFLVGDRLVRAARVAVADASESSNENA